RRRDSLRRVVRMRHGACPGAILWLPLLRAGGTLRELPFVAKQVLKKIFAPLRWRGGPGGFQTAGDRVGATACSKTVFPTESDFVERGAFGIGTHIRRRGRTVGLSKCVAASDERDRFLVVHCHPLKRLADIDCRRDRIGIAI